MMTENGVFRARSIKRKPEQERWDKEFLEKAVGTPWEPIPGRHKGDKTDLPGDVTVIPASEAGIPEAQPAAEPRGAPRRVCIRKVDLMRYGYTSGCKGCEAARTPGAQAVHHEQKCRDRIVRARARGFNYM